MTGNDIGTGFDNDHDKTQTTIDPGAAVCPIVPPFGKLSATLPWRDGRIFFFSGSDCVSYDKALGRIDLNYPRSIRDQWPGIPFATVDAVLDWGNGYVYFFSGTQYARYFKGDLQKPEGFDKGPDPISGNWPGLPFSSIDAALDWGNNKVYFFSGNYYVRYHKGDSSKPEGAETGRIRIDGGNWPRLRFSRIDATFDQGDGRVFFFSDHRYVSYRKGGSGSDEGAEGPPMVTNYDWPACVQGLEERRLPEWTHDGLFHTRRGYTGNGVLYTSQALILLELTGRRPKETKAGQDLLSALSRCQVREGLYRRTIAPNEDPETWDDYHGLITMSIILGIPKIGEDIFKYGKENNWVYANRTIPFEPGQTHFNMLTRPALLCALYWAAGQHPPPQLLLIWNAVVAQDLKGLDRMIREHYPTMPRSERAAHLNKPIDRFEWMLVQAYYKLDPKFRTWASDGAVSKFWQLLPKDDYFKKEFIAYTQEPCHPLSQVWHDFRCGSVARSY